MDVSAALPKKKTTEKRAAHWSWWHLNAWKIVFWSVIRSLAARLFDECSYVSPFVCGIFSPFSKFWTRTRCVCVCVSDSNENDLNVFTLQANHTSYTRGRAPACLINVAKYVRVHLNIWCNNKCGKRLAGIHTRSLGPCVLFDWIKLHLIFILVLVVCDASATKWVSEWLWMSAAYFTFAD